MNPTNAPISRARNTSATFSRHACCVGRSLSPHSLRHGPGAQNVTHRLKYFHVVLPLLDCARPTPCPRSSGLINGTCGWNRSGRVSVLPRASVGCRSGGGASVRIGIDESPVLPGFRTNDFVKSVFRDGIVGIECAEAAVTVLDASLCAAQRIAACRRL